MSDDEVAVELASDPKDAVAAATAAPEPSAALSTFEAAEKQKGIVSAGI